MTNRREISEQSDMRGCQLLLLLASPLATAFNAFTPIHVARPVARPAASVAVRRATLPLLQTDEDKPLKKLFVGYKASGAVTCAAWAACSWISMSRVPLGTLPTLHNGLCVASALAPLPLIWSYFSVLSNACIKGWSRLSLLTYRRLNLAMMTATGASLLAVLCASAATNGIVSYGSGFALFALAAAFGSATALTTAVFARTDKPGEWTLNPLALVNSAVDVGVDILANILPTPTLKPLKGGANKYAVLSVAFGVLTIIQWGSFPLATVPSFLGARLARAFSAWTLLACVACHALHDAADRGRLEVETTFRTLKLGLEGFATSHLLLVLLKAAIDSPARYPAALACPAWSLASIAVFALALRPDETTEGATARAQTQ